MQERLLQFIWKEKYFNRSALRTETGETLEILDSGELNTNQGPDFLQARIFLDGTLWAGNIELHVRSSYWHDHRHGSDPLYRNIILHVVWENDDPALARLMPTLVLQDRVSNSMLERYASLMEAAARSGIACRDLLDTVPPVLWQEWKELLLQQRLRRKAALFRELWQEAGKDWEKACWWWMARHFGGTVNGAFFEKLARSIEWKWLLKHRGHPEQLEAFLLGQAGLLPEASADPYVQLLKREYAFLLNKYQLPVVHGVAQKLRMRPAAFPELRLAQLAVLVKERPKLYASLIGCEQWQEAERLLDITAGDFWHYHYQLDNAAAYHPKRVGTDMCRQLIINAICPLLYATGQHLQQPAFQLRALSWLSSLPPEKNTLTDEWLRLGVAVSRAGDSQALVELKRNYCLPRRCLECRVGHFLLEKGRGAAPG